MRSCRRFLWLGLLMAFAGAPADAAPCGVRKGLYESWLSLAKRTQRLAPKSDPLLGSTPSAPDPFSAQGIRDEYRTFFQCLSDAPVPREDAAASFCKEAASDRLSALVCEAALYVKTGRGEGKDLLDALPATRKGAEMIWELDTIASPYDGKNFFPEMFLPRGPAYQVIDELFVLVLDDRETAMAKYFHIAGASAGAGAKYMDAQIRILLRESPAVVVKRWEVLRQYQPRLKKIMADLAQELPAGDMNVLRLGIAGFCAKENLDCPEILKVFGRPE
jgi:hypothetical protein